MYLGNLLISWRAKKQESISYSSSEAEYRVMSYIAYEVQWITYMLTNLGAMRAAPVLIYCDCKFTIYIAENPIFHECTKHVEIDCHVVCEKVHHGLIKKFHMKIQF